MAHFIFVARIAMDHIPGAAIPFLVGFRCQELIREILGGVILSEIQGGGILFRLAVNQRRRDRSFKIASILEFFGFFEFIFLVKPIHCYHPLVYLATGSPSTSTPLL